MTKSPEPQPSTRLRDLSREKIIAAGLELLDNGGTSAITMRSVAERLGVTPMALYNHVDSKADLLRIIAEQLIRSVRFDSGNPDWRTRIGHCFRELRDLCLRHPDLAGILETAGAAPASVFEPMEVTLTALRRIGLGDTDALRGYFTLVSFTLGQVDYQNRGPFPDLAPARYAGDKQIGIRQLAVADHWDFAAAFEFGLGLILDGLEAAAERR